MSLTLGEKLRQAREERGISISEVADQTRISALYIASIENDDYRTLPGGIFNKGFVKSFAKYVGVDEQEALQDYGRLIASQGGLVTEEPKTYRPEVLTDDRPSSLNPVTLILAGILLAAIVGGGLLVVKYLAPMATQTANSNTNQNANIAQNINIASTAPTPVPSTNELKVEFTADGGDIYLSSVNDGKSANNLIKKGNALNFEPKEKLRLSLARERVQMAKLTLNGKEIALPAAPARGSATVEITKENAAQILESGKIELVAAPAPTRTRR